MPEFPENPPPPPRFPPEPTIGPPPLPAPEGFANDAANSEMPVVPVVPPQFLPPQKARVYGVPRRYGLDSILVVVTSFGLLFGLLNCVGARIEFIVLFVLFVAGVGLAQAVLFGGKNPRLASVLAGVGMWLLLGFGAAALSYAIQRERFHLENFLCPMVSGVWFAPVLGYVAGTFVAGVFLVLDGVETLLRKRRAGSHSVADEPPDGDPFGPKHKESPAESP